MAEKITPINPAAGPLMANLLLLKNVVTTPPTTAVINPAIGGIPIATAIANDKGSATKDTEIAATTSFLQCFVKPFKPVCGMSFLDFAIIHQKYVSIFFLQKVLLIVS